MWPNTPSPLLETPGAEWLCGKSLCFVIFNRFPVSPGRVLMITRRGMPTHVDCPTAEQATAMKLVGEFVRPWGL